MTSSLALSALLCFDCESEPRAAVTERNVYDFAKVNVRRPPKGIQNWFDAFSVGSDEEEQAQQSVSSAAQSETGASGSQGVGQELSVDDWGKISDRVTLDYSGSSRRSPQSRRSIGSDLVMANCIAIKTARRRLRARQHPHGSSAVGHNSQSFATLSGDSRAGRQIGYGSRLAMSQLNKESVLTLSESSEDEQPHAPLYGVEDSVWPGVIVRNELPVHSGRREHRKERLLANDSHVASGPVQTMPTALTIEETPSTCARERTSTQRRLCKHVEAASGEQFDHMTLKQSQRQSGISRKEGSSKCAFDESIQDSRPHRLRMMAVTDEEMTLLKMVRKKRAEMRGGIPTERVTAVYLETLRSSSEHNENRRRG